MTINENLDAIKYHGTKALSSTWEGGAKYEIDRALVLASDSIKHVLSADALEDNCQNCDGAGCVESNYSSMFAKKCVECDGSGKVPTEYGRELLNFVKKHIHATITLD